MNVGNEIKRLARKICANFTGTDGCLLCPNGQSKCNFYREDDQARPYVEDGTIRCLYFEWGVLPSDPALERRYWNRTPANAAKCSRCGDVIVKRSNRQKYCDRCAKSAERTRSREGMRKYRVDVNV